MICSPTLRSCAGEKRDLRRVAEIGQQRSAIAVRSPVRATRCRTGGARRAGPASRGKLVRSRPPGGVLTTRCAALAGAGGASARAAWSSCAIATAAATKRRAKRGCACAGRTSFIDVKMPARPFKFNDLRQRDAQKRRRRRSQRAAFYPLRRQGAGAHGRRGREGSDPSGRPRRRPHRDAGRDARARFASGRCAKGDVLLVARVAAIAASKRTADLIPLCHPLPLTRVAVEFAFDERHAAVAIEVTAETRRAHGRRDGSAHRGGGGTAHDLRHVQGRRSRHAHRGVRLLEKSGGRSGHYVADR